MIRAKIAQKLKIMLVFDSPQTLGWVEEQRITQDGIGHLLGRLYGAGVDTFTEVSAITLSDVRNPKAKDFKEKQDYVNEVLETYQCNLLVPIGAKAFELVMGHKGIERYYDKSIWSDKHQCKVVPCPNPSMVHFKPEIEPVLQATAERIAAEKDSPALVVADKIPVQYHIIDTFGKFLKLMEVLQLAPRFTFDLETTGLNWLKDEITTIQFSHRPYYSYLIPTTFYNGKWTAEEWLQIQHHLRELFNGLAGTSRVVVGHNLKFDLKFAVKNWGIDVPAPENMADTMVMSFLVDENTPNDLKYLACRYTDLGDYEFPLEQWKASYCKEHKLKVEEFSYGVIPFDILAPYALTDTDATFRVHDFLLQQLAEEEQTETFTMLMQFFWTTLHMELQGWPVDVEYATQYLGELTEKIAALEVELLQSPDIQAASVIIADAKLRNENAKRKNKLTELKEPFEFNLGSTKQKSVLFFEVLNLPVLKYTKTKNSDGKRTTPAQDKECLEEWITRYPQHEEFLSKLRTYNELCKMKSTYVEALIEGAVDGFIHPRYNITGAKTGRLSSSSPNFQNLPVRNAEAKNVKRIIKAPPGWVLLGADLHAAEMRWAAICSGDPLLIQIFLDGVDVHGAVAKEVFNLDCHPNEVKVKYPELRDISKTIQFLSLYGGGPDTLASKVKIKKSRAVQILEVVMRELDLGEVNTDGVPQFDFVRLVEQAGPAAQLLAEAFQFPLDKAMAVIIADDKPAALMQAFAITKEQAQALLTQYFTRYAGLDAFIKTTTQETKQTGYSRSLLGRRRRVPAAKASDSYAAERALRQAVNATVQSVASDGLMDSAYNLQRHLLATGETRMKLLGPIHDALYCLVREDFVLQGRDLLIQFMTQFPAGVDSPIPMKSDAEWGYDWAHFSEDFAAGGFEELWQEEDEKEEEEKLAA